MTATNTSSGSFHLTITKKENELHRNENGCPYGRFRGKLTSRADSVQPPIASRQRQRSEPHPILLQAHAPVFPPPQNSYHIPHQGAPGTLGSALTDPSTHPASAAPVTQCGSIAGHKDTLSDVHPHLRAVQSPPIAVPRHMGSPIHEENMYHPAHTSPSMMTTLRPHAPVYQDRTPPDLVPTPSHILLSSASALISPIYPHALTSGPLSSAHHSTPYSMHGAYTPMGYTTPPSYAYPSPPSFVPAPSIHGSHSPPPHHSRPYGFPTGQESQGTWWYSPPGATVTFNSFEGAQHVYQPRLTAGYPPVGQLDGEPPDQRNTASLPFEPQPTRRQTNRTGVGRRFDDVKQEAAQAPSPTSPTRARTKHQERRSYHPKLPAHRSEWVMWTGNVPSDVKQDELREFFNQPLPPLSPAQTEPPKDWQPVYGGVSIVFIISRSNCAFVNFESEAQLEAAMARFDGQPIRPDDRRCPSLVCRVRRKEDDLMSGVGAQRGSGMHIKWVKEQKIKVQRAQADAVGSPKDMTRHPSPLSVSIHDSRWIGEGYVSTHSNLSHSPSVVSTNSDILTRYFPQRYFIVKSLTQYDLDLSVQKNIWATQRHNEEILDQAYRTSKDVFLIFSVNKSGEFYGYARMAGSVLRDEIGMPWESANGSAATPTSVSSSSEMNAGTSPSPDDTGAKPQDPFYYIFPPDEHQAVEWSPQSAPAGQPSFALAEPHELYNRLTNTMPNSSTPRPPRALSPVQALSSQLSSDALSHSFKNSPPRGTRESVEHDGVSGPILVVHKVSEAHLDDRPKPVPEVSFEGRDTRDDGTGSALDRAFRIEWIRTDSLPFYRTRHLRNPWNRGREVKVSRDGTELEPTVGQQLLDKWDRPSVAVDNSPSPPGERRRGPNSTKYLFFT